MTPHHPPALLRAGWPKDQVLGNHTAAASELVDEGYVFRKANEKTHLSAARHLLARELPGNPDRDMGGDVATTVVESASGEVIAAMRMMAMTHPALGVTAKVLELAVDPQHRGKRVGLVLLGMVGYIVELHSHQAVRLTHGWCAADSARLYQRAGFDVYQPGERLRLGAAELAAGTDAYPCAFVRAW